MVRCLWGGRWSWAGCLVDGIPKPKENSRSWMKWMKESRSFRCRTRFEPCKPWRNLLHLAAVLVAHDDIYGCAVGVIPPSSPHPKCSSNPMHLSDPLGPLPSTPWSCCWRATAESKAQVSAGFSWKSELFFDFSCVWTLILHLSLYHWRVSASSDINSCK